MFGSNVHINPTLHVYRLYMSNIVSFCFIAKNLPSQKRKILTTKEKTQNTRFL